MVMILSGVPEKKESSPDEIIIPGEVFRIEYVYPDRINRDPTARTPSATASAASRVCPDLV